MHRVARWHETAFANWPAVVALLAGTGVGAYTAGLIPGLAGFQSTYIGFPAVQAWVTGAIVYLLGVAACYRRSNVNELLGFPHLESAAQGDGGAQTLPA